jgi:hypothetical protein
MKIMYFLIIVILIGGLITSIGTVYAQYGSGFSLSEHYPPTNDTELELLVVNSTEFKEKTMGYSYTSLGVDYNWISKGNNYYDFGGARVSFVIAGLNGTEKGVAFNLNQTKQITSVFEYNVHNPPAGYRVDTKYGNGLITGPSKNGTGTIPNQSPKPSKMLFPLEQFKSGIAANNVKCDNNLQLVVKAEDGSPACVKPTTSNILIERGWAKAL